MYISNPLLAAFRRDLPSQTRMPLRFLFGKKGVDLENKKISDFSGPMLRGVEAAREDIFRDLTYRRSITSP